ncbi:hypothetical protein TSUD_25550 [Trifolium subterraneum]|uniref:RNA helicase n=1 Tax=Trifolium subterraneum TaxID=3900 RepID=A0A2Z6NJ20_TRISU|nr:hypothetical protein TSUD_25550 [Trifolium subterraneum]
MEESSTTSPPPPATKSWADQADDEDANPSSSSAAETEPPSIDELNIDVNKKSPSKMLDDPDDSNIQAVTSGDTPYTSAATFEELSLSPELLKGLYVEMKFEKPSKIQAVSLPMILNPPHRDLIAQAHNGSGKTTCFVLGMLSRVDPTQQSTQALCICPTRELAIQNVEVLRKMGKYTGISSECSIPMDKRDSIPISKRPPIMAQVVIGTPGTIKNLMTYKKLGVTRLKILVFDEADQMLAEDHWENYMDALCRNDMKMPADSAGITCIFLFLRLRGPFGLPQFLTEEWALFMLPLEVLLFSATFNDIVKNFVTRIVEKKEHNKLFVKKEELSLDAVKQYKVRVSDETEKIEVIKNYIFEIGENVGQTIIFVRTRDSAKMLHKALVDLGYEVTSIQGNLEHDQRDKIIKEFKDGLTQVLISTDVLARGFDQQQINLVINYDLPLKYAAGYNRGRELEPDFEVYLHRVGRAGRFGRKGAVFNLICGERDEKVMSKIENHFGTHIKEVQQNSVDDYKAALKEAGLLF